MRGKKWLTMGGVFAAGFLAFSLSWGQPGNGEKKVLSPVKYVPESKTKKVNLTSLPFLDRQAYLGGLRGAEWLMRANRPDGRFVFGYVPALNISMEGDDLLLQIQAAAALGRAAAYFENERAAAIARQAVLTLLLNTAVDPKAPDVRYPNLPPFLVNRLATAGLLVLAIHELPSPGKDLLDQSRQLCNYIRKQQRADGSLDLGGPELKDAAALTAISYFPGMALYGLARSQQHLPAPWKIDMLRKALPYYARWWKEHKNLAMISWQTAAAAEVYQASRDPALAEGVFAMNDWLCERQYQPLDPNHPKWLGGFKGWRDGKEVFEAPEAGSAAHAESLAHACRVVRQAGDPLRWKKYRPTLERAIQFLNTLQYTDGNTQHFAEWYRSYLVGAFHASHQDGNLRLDYTARADSALVLYLKYVAEVK